MVNSSDLNLRWQRGETQAADESLPHNFHLFFFGLRTASSSNWGCVTIRQHLTPPPVIRHLARILERLRPASSPILASFTIINSSLSLPLIHLLDLLDLLEGDRLFAHTHRSRSLPGSEARKRAKAVVVGQSSSTMGGQPSKSSVNAADEKASLRQMPRESRAVIPSVEDETRAKTMGRGATGECNEKMVTGGTDRVPQPLSLETVASLPAKIVKDPKDR